MLTLFNASTSTEIFEANACSQTPGFLSTKTPRKVTLRKKLAEAHTTIKPVENDVNHLTMCPQQADTIENVCIINVFSKCIFDVFQQLLYYKLSKIVTYM